MTEDELLECPFCGSMPYQEESADDPPWLRIGCDNCEYYIITKDGDFEALKKKWNTRVFPAWLREKIDTEIVRIKNKKMNCLNVVFINIYCQLIPQTSIIYK